MGVVGTLSGVYGADGLGFEDEESSMSVSEFKYAVYCHSPLPDWIADAGELALGVDMGAPQDSRKGILAINSNSN